jgi:hypothetical protein
MLTPSMFMSFKDGDFINIVKLIEIFLINDVIYFYAENFSSTFDSHYHAFEIKSINCYNLYPIEIIYHYHPFNSVKNMNRYDNRLFIRQNVHLSNYA